MSTPGSPFGGAASDPLLVCPSHPNRPAQRATVVSPTPATPDTEEVPAMPTRRCSQRGTDIRFVLCAIILTLAIPVLPSGGAFAQEPPYPHATVLEQKDFTNALNAASPPAEIRNPTGAKGCMQACVANETCGSWNFLRPSGGDADGHCWLLNGWATSPLRAEPQRDVGFVDRTRINTARPATGAAVAALGTWTWWSGENVILGNGTCVLRQNGTARGRCTWGPETKDGRQYLVFRWADGPVQWMTSISETRMDGRDQYNTKLEATRTKGPESSPPPGDGTGSGTGTGGGTGTTVGPGTTTGQGETDLGRPDRPNRPRIPDSVQHEVPLSVRVGTRTVEPGGTVDVPVELIGSGDVASLNVTIRYDPAVVSVVGTPARGSALGDALFEANASPRGEPGIIYLGFAGKASVSTGSPFAGITFKAVGRAGSRAALVPSVTSANASGGAKVGVATIDGAVEIRQASLTGDSDGDGRLTANDAKNALKMSVRLLDEDRKCDMDKDGRVTANDARLILQAVVGK